MTTWEPCPQSCNPCKSDDEMRITQTQSQLGLLIHVREARCDPTKDSHRNQGWARQARTNLCLSMASSTLPRQRQDDAA